MTSFPGATRERKRRNAEAIETHGVRFLSRYSRDLTSDESGLVQGYRGLTRDRQRELVNC
jgi:hypothetical protein